MQHLHVCSRRMQSSQLNCKSARAMVWSESLVCILGHHELLLLSVGIQGSPQFLCCRLVARLQLVSKAHAGSLLVQQPPTAFLSISPSHHLLQMCPFEANVALLTSWLETCRWFASLPVIHFSNCHCSLHLCHPWQHQLQTDQPKASGCCCTAVHCRFSLPQHPQHGTTS